MKKHLLLYSVIIIVTFMAAFYGRSIISKYIIIPVNSEILQILYNYMWWILPTSVMTGILFGFHEIFDNLGLKKGFLTGLIFSLVTVSPMLISSAIIGDPPSQINIPDLLQKTVFAGLFEEYLFRGFLFGLLFSKLRWGFIPAALPAALIFGLGHIYQGNSLSATFGVFFVTALGSLWFSWLFVEWKNNLWIPVFLHILMNLSWILFDVSDDALGGVYTNLFRIITIALTVFLTIKYHKQKGLVINKSNLFINKNVR